MLSGAIERLGILQEGNRQVECAQEIGLIGAALWGDQRGAHPSPIARGINVARCGEFERQGGIKRTIEMEMELRLRHLKEEATRIIGTLEFHCSPPHALSRRLRTRVRISARERILLRMTSSLPVATDSRALGAWLRDATPVDRIGIEERVATLKTRSIKKSSKVWALRLALSMCDITTLEGKDTPGKIRQLATKAMRPLPGDASMPSVAALCCYPDLVGVAKEALKGSSVKVAAVATAFPSGRSWIDLKIAETKYAVAAGADEIDMVIDRGAFLAGDYAKVWDEIVAIKEACGPAHLKVILETGELGTYDDVRRASALAIAAGGDFIKTSTGKVTPAATLPVTLVMLETIREHWNRTGKVVGMKPAGGIRTAKEAIQYLVVVHETLGPDWLTPDRFRFGASSLVNDLLMQLEKEVTGAYADPDDFTLD
jgi:deoxyribose-phosphate aldolase